MSELKVFEVTQKTLFGRTCTRKVYDKDEADKVIAEKDKAIEELRNEADVYKAKYEQEYDIAVHNEKQLSAMRIEIRRQKYKRCLAIALLCFINGKEKQSVYKLKTFFWSRWGNRWWKLAEKFKEAK